MAKALSLYTRDLHTQMICKTIEDKINLLAYKKDDFYHKMVYRILQHNYPPPIRLYIRKSEKSLDFEI